MNDILLDETHDLQIVNGDLVIGEATLQHQNHILLAHKGEYKNAPEIGVGVLAAVNDENPRTLLNDIKRNFEYDGMQVKSLRFTPEGTINIDATYL